MTLFLRSINLASVLIISSVVSGQVSVSGPRCVMPGVKCSYAITGIWDRASTMKVCITGGVVADTAFTNGCMKTGAPIAAIEVLWDSTANGSITIGSTKGSGEIRVVKAHPLEGGQIDTTVSRQRLKPGLLPLAILCSSARTGSCSPGYQYQWQASNDAVSWIDLAGETKATLRFTTPIKTDSYFRRRVLDTGSGTLSYSNISSVLITE